MTLARCVPILTYHSIADSTTGSFRPFTVTPARFAEHLAALRAAGWSRMTYTKAVDTLANTDLPTGRRTVAVTVDDGFEDFVVHALPVLAAARATATVFVPTAHVGGTARWLAGADSQRRLMDWASLSDVAAAGIEIGSHGHQHAPLDVGHAAAVYNDLATSRLLLEDRLGTAVTALAYPFGYQRSVTRRAAMQAGFRTACTASGAPACRRDHVLAMPRLPVTQAMTGLDVVHAIERRYTSWERRWRCGKQQVWELGRVLGLVGPQLLATYPDDPLTRHPPESSRSQR